MVYFTLLCFLSYFSGVSDTTTKSSTVRTPGENKMAVSSPSPSNPSSPSDGLLTSEESESSKVGDDAKILPNLPDSPPLTDATSEEPDYSKMNMYSPTAPDQFPDGIATEGQTSLQTAAVSDVQGAKGYVPASTEYPVSSHSDITNNYCSMTTLATNGYSHPPSCSPTSLMSPIPYTVPYNAAFGETIGIGAYPSMSPSGYVSPYGTKQYSWPTTPAGVTYPNAFTMNSHDLSQTCYPYQSSSGAPTYPQVTTARPTYPGYFSAQISAPTTQSC